MDKMPSRRKILEGIVGAGAAAGVSALGGVEAEGAPRPLDSAEAEKILVEIRGHAKEFESMMEKLEKTKGDRSLEPLQGGFIAANVMDSAFEHLDAIIRLRSRLPERPRSVK